MNLRFQHTVEGSSPQDVPLTYNKKAIVLENTRCFLIMKSQNHSDLE